MLKQVQNQELLLRVLNNKIAFINSKNAKKKQRKAHLSLLLINRANLGVSIKAAANYIRRKKILMRSVNIIREPLFFMTLGNIGLAVIKKVGIGMNL